MIIEEILTEAQRYEDMFAGIGLPDEHTKEIQWAKQTLKKQDRVVWYLRWYRMAYLRKMALRDDNANTALVKLEADYTKKTNNQPPVINLDDIRELKKELEHFMGLQSADIQKVVFQWQSPDEILDIYREHEQKLKDKVQNSSKHVEEYGTKIMSFPL